MTNANEERQRKDARYLILAQGPDNHSTYGPCWGSTATSSGDFVADCDTLAECREIIHDLGHCNYSIRDRRKHETFSGPALKDMATAGCV